MLIEEIRLSTAKQHAAVVEARRARHGGHLGSACGTTSEVGHRGHTDGLGAGTTPTTGPTTYTLLGLSSNTAIGANTSTTSILPLVTTSNNIGYFLAAVPPNNKPVKMEMGTSARMAMGYGANVYVSNAPLSLNNPLSLINVSADKCLTTDAAGNKLTGASNTVAVSGTVTALEWSKNGTELYYATNDALSGNKFLYRVSYLDALLDSTAKSYSGKLHPNVFTFSNKFRLHQEIASLIISISHQCSSLPIHLSQILYPGLAISISPLPNHLSMKILVMC